MINTDRVGTTASGLNSSRELSTPMAFHSFFHFRFDTSCKYMNCTHYTARHTTHIHITSSKGVEFPDFQAFVKVSYVFLSIVKGCS
jgi:hypothetical protein